MVVDRVEINPAVMLGKPVIRGTLITVELILRMVSEGAPVEDLLDAYQNVPVNRISAQRLAFSEEPGEVDKSKNYHSEGKIGEYRFQGGLHYHFTLFSLQQALTRRVKEFALE
ncbi:MAG: DUF433 domain-containing protein [Chloroflexi bacterium]|nr:DUF433 domain-containing protein [Chloroflexota bacterium]